MEAKAGGRDGEGEVAASSRLRGTCNVAQLEAFWTTVVEEGLFMSSHERRAVGFTLFQVRTCDLGLGLGLGLGLDLHCRGAMGLWLHRLRLVHLHLPCITCTSCLTLTHTRTSCSTRPAPHAAVVLCCRRPCRVRRRGRKASPPR